MAREQFHTGAREMESAEAPIDFPSVEQLRRWWKEEQEFMNTPIGRHWYNMRHEIWRLHMEHAHYQKVVLNYAEREPHDPRMRLTLKDIKLAQPSQPPIE